MTDRTIIVDVGDWDRREVYRGTNVFLAGLAAARAWRDRRPCSSVNYCDPENCDDESDGLDKEVHAFLGGCLEIGAMFASKRRRAA